MWDTRIKKEGFKGYPNGIGVKCYQKIVWMEDTKDFESVDPEGFFRFFKLEFFSNKNSVIKRRGYIYVNLKYVYRVRPTLN
jgi:hypothetical protein